VSIHIPYHWAKSNKIVIDTSQEVATIITCQDTQPWAVAEIFRRFGSHPIRKVDTSELQTMLQKVYSQDGDAASVVNEISQDDNLDRLLQEIPVVEDLLDVSDNAPVVRMINALFTQAVREGASDIHLEIFDTYSTVRYRIDGTLRHVAQPRRALHQAMISRIKIMAGLDIAEKRLPQDGRISLKVGGKNIDVRVSTLPTGHGERAVLRLLDKSAAKLELEKLGMTPDVLAHLDALIHRPHGIVLVTGPTGSGKSTTLYSALSRLDTTSTNILTVEDPIEYDLAGIGQTQVNPRIELGFARALRAILRQDPDVIMIGEIRDLETAQIAVQAALTGHLVLATLHTNDAVSAITRLTDMGIEHFLLASTLQGVLAQRLVRLLCQHCRQPDTESGHYMANTAGCTHCGYTGYRGRSGIHELMIIDEKLRHMIHEGASEQEIRTNALDNGMRTLYQDAQRWLCAGLTSLAEIARVTRDT